MRLFHKTSMESLKHTNKKLWLLSKQEVNVTEFWGGKLTFDEILMQNTGKMCEANRLYQVRQIIATHPRNPKHVINVTHFFVLWLTRKPNGDLWVTKEPKRSFLPSGTWIVQRYYRANNIDYRNQYLTVLNEPSDLDAADTVFDKSSVNKLVRSVTAAPRTASNTVDDSEILRLTEAAVAVGDELLAGEGETDFDCIENDIDERSDTTEVELVKALKKIDRKRAESRLFFRNPRPVWSPVEKLMRKQFEDKFCTERGLYKYYVGYHADHI